MSRLDDELRSAFQHQAQTRMAPPPAPDALVRGGRARRVRRNLRWTGAGVAAAMLLGVGGYGVASWEVPSPPGAASRPSDVAPSASVPADDVPRPSLAPSIYRMPVRTAAAGGPIEADITIDGDNWVGGDFLLASERSGSVFAGVGVYQPSSLAAGTGCLADARTTPARPTPAGLAQQLAGLPRSTVLVAPTRVRAFGRTGLHLRLRIDVECPSYYRLAETPSGARGITYAPLGVPAQNVAIDFWVFEVDGAVVVVDQWHTIDASYALVSQAARARASVTLVVGR